MSSNEYLDNLMKELAEQGIEPPKANINNVNTSNVNDKELEIITSMERITGRKFSDEQRKILEYHGNACILACAGSGKALVNGTGVLTPNGYVSIEQLKVGDKVLDENGCEQIVLGVYPQGKKRVYNVIFENGDVIKCCKDHLWTIFDELLHDRSTVTTLDIKRLLESENRTTMYRDGITIPNISVQHVTIPNSMFNTCIEIICEELKYEDTINNEIKENFNNKHSINDLCSDIIENSYGGKVIIKSNTILELVRFYLDFNGIIVINQSFDNYYHTIEFEDLHSYSRAIVNVEKTDKYEEMTCIKVSGLSELFLTEHCIVTHNTTISVNLIAKRILTGEIKDVNKLIYTTFSKAGADEMKERMDKLMGQLGMGHINVQVRTLHSFFLSVIRTFGLNKRIINASERTKMVRQACKDAEYSLKDDDLMIIDNLLSYQMNNLLTNKKLVESYVNTLEDLTVEKYSIINASFRKQKDDGNCMDYDDMQYYLWLWLVKWQKSSNQVEKDTAVAVRNYCKAVYTDFYIDEAQDVSKIQFEIIKAIVSDPDNKNKLDKNLVFIGDDDQCIYQWRGSDPSIILTIGAKFNMQTFVLSTNYRCLNEIVDYAATGIKCNNSRFDKSMNAFNNGGSVKIYPSAKEDLCTLSIAALNQIKYWLSQGDKVSDIAVLSRNNFHLALLSNMLLREGIYCNMTEDMKLTKSYMYSDVKDIIALSEPTWKADLTAKVLWRLCRYMGAANSRIIASFQDSCALSLEDTLGWLLKHFVNKDLDFSKKLNINMQAEQQMQYQMAKLSSETTNDMYTLYRTLSSGSREDKIRSLLYQYLQATSFMYKSKDKNRSITGLVQYIINLMKKDGVDKMLEFMRVTEQLEGGKMVIPGDKLTLTTIHSAKGREWKNVIMFGCDNVSQPSFDGIYGMIQDDIPMSDILRTLTKNEDSFMLVILEQKRIYLSLLIYSQAFLFLKL